MHDRLIYGKNETKRIVSIEPKDDQTEVFIQNEDHTVSSHVINNRYWILSNNNIDQTFARLAGNLHYKWGKQFSTREDFISFKKQHQKYDLYSIHDQKESAMVKDGITYFKGMKPQDVSILSFDIETTGLNAQANDAAVLLISNTLRNGNKIQRKLFAYSDYHNDPVQMVEAWSEWVRSVNPSIICGHNIYSFDLKYLSEYMQVNGRDLYLGRDDSAIRFETYES